MPRFIRLVIAVVAGYAVGSVVNMGLILAGSHVIPPPAGADVTTTEGLKAAMPLFEPRHFVFPFLAHALGTFAGVFVATLLAPDRSRGPAWTVGTLFLLGGIAAIYMFSAPPLFNSIDLLLAYGPPGLAGYWLATRGRRTGGTTA